MTLATLGWEKIRGVCFDLGGTLVRPDTHPTTGQVAHVLGIPLPEARAVMERRAKRRRITPDELALDLAASFQHPQTAEPLRRLLSAAQHRAAAPDLYDDAIPTLIALRQRGMALYALTNCLGSSIPEAPVPFHDFLDAVIHSADTGACKPEREAFAAVESASGLPPDRLLQVGDSLRADVAGALAVGWHAAYLYRPPGRPPQSMPAPAVRIRTLTSLLHLLPGPARPAAPQPLPVKEVR